VERPISRREVLAGGAAVAVSAALAAIPVAAAETSSALDWLEQAELDAIQVGRQLMPLTIFGPFTTPNWLASRRGIGLMFGPRDAPCQRFGGDSDLWVSDFAALRARALECGASGLPTCPACGS
jgi:hypothetical protein